MATSLETGVVTSFPEATATIEVQYDPDDLDLSTVNDCLITSGGGPVGDRATRP